MNRVFNFNLGSVIEEYIHRLKAQGDFPKDIRVKISIDSSNFFHLLMQFNRDSDDLFLLEASH